MFDPGPAYATTSAPRIFALPIGCDFPQALVAGLRARMADHPPEAMSRVTLYLNTQRMQTRITQIFLATGPCFLPKLRLISQLADDPRLDLPKPASPLRRQLEIANLVTALLQADRTLAPSSAAFDLALSLDRLLNEMQAEAVTPEAIARLDVGQHSEHWARAQRFLNIVTPLFYAGTGPDARRRAAAAGLAALWQAQPPMDPILIAGTTGSRKSTAEFMHSVCALPQGAVILPGYDFDLQADVWQQMDDVLQAEDHPQFRFRRLMDRIGFGPEDVQKWHDTPVHSENRNKLISLSLRPAPVTDQWLRDGPKLQGLIAATADLTLIEAPSSRSEALAIALVLRKAVQDGTRAALITPDRVLSRQVTAALDRWGIVPDDSAGRPLALSAAGRLMRHTAALMAEPLTLDRLVIALKHPLTASGDGRGHHLLLLRELEVKLRRFGPVFPDLETVLNWAAQQRIAGATEWALALAPLFSAGVGPAPRTLSRHIADHIALTEALARGTAMNGTGALWDGAAGREIRNLMDELTREADAAAPLTIQDYRAMFETLVAGREVREAPIADPNILIWGTIEARVQGCDLVILGGLNDAVWPKLPEPDAWLNRPMRRDAGLLLPDRQIGLAAHDYQQAIAAKVVVLTRAKRNADSETIPSRWLNRLTNLMDGLACQDGPAALAAMRGRGEEWLRLARDVDRPSAAQTADPALRLSPRPAPVPPLALRPRELALTAMENLITNPYHIYARYILKLHKLPPLRAAVDARDRGTAVHLILERFVKGRPDGETRPMARARLQAIAAEVFAQEVPFPSVRALWLAKLMQAAGSFLAEDQRFGGQALAIESKGRMHLPSLNFTLTGTPDRIDRLSDGTLHLIDYKTSSAPTKAEQDQHRKQLRFAAVMAQAGGFAQLGPATVSTISYITLSRGGKPEHSVLSPQQIETESRILHDLVAAYQCADVGYTARRADFKDSFEGDYDLLMRFGEWQTSDDAVLIPVGNLGVAP